MVFLSCMMTKVNDKKKELYSGRDGWGLKYKSVISKAFYLNWDYRLPLISVIPSKFYFFPEGKDA